MIWVVLWCIWSGRLIGIEIDLEIHEWLSIGWHRNSMKVPVQLRINWIVSVIITWFIKYKLECKNCSGSCIYQFGVVFLYIFCSSKIFLLKSSHVHFCSSKRDAQEKMAWICGCSQINFRLSKTHFCSKEIIFLKLKKTKKIDLNFNICFCVSVLLLFIIFN